MEDLIFIKGTKFHTSIVAENIGAPTLRLSGTTYSRKSPAGNGSIWGTIVEHIDGVDYPRSRKVCVHRQRDGYFVASVFSDPITGEYRFDGLDETIAFFVIAFDHTGQNGAVIGDSIYPTKIVE